MRVQFVTTALFSSPAFIEGLGCTRLNVPSKKTVGSLHLPVNTQEILADSTMHPMKLKRCYKFVLLFSFLLFVVPVCLQMNNSFSIWSASNDLGGAEIKKLKLSKYAAPPSTKYRKTSQSGRLSADRLEDFGDFEVVDVTKKQNSGKQYVEPHRLHRKHKLHSRHPAQRNGMGRRPELQHSLNALVHELDKKQIKLVRHERLLMKKKKESQYNVQHKGKHAITTYQSNKPAGELKDAKISIEDKVRRVLHRPAPEIVHKIMNVEVNGFKLSKKEANSDGHKKDDNNLYAEEMNNQSRSKFTTTLNCSSLPGPNCFSREDLSRYEQCCQLSHLTPSQFTQAGEKCQFFKPNSKRSHSLTALSASPMGGANDLRVVLEEVTGTCTGSLSCDPGLRRRGLAGENIASSAVLLVKVDDIGRDLGSEFDSLVFLLRNPYHSMLEKWEESQAGE